MQVVCLRAMFNLNKRDNHTNITRANRLALGHWWLSGEQQKVQVN